MASILQRTRTVIGSGGGHDAPYGADKTATGKSRRAAGSSHSTASQLGSAPPARPHSAYVHSPLLDDINYLDILKVLDDPSPLPPRQTARFSVGYREAGKDIDLGKDVESLVATRVRNGWDDAGDPAPADAVDRRVRRPVTTCAPQQQRKQRLHHRHASVIGQSVTMPNALPAQHSRTGNELTAIEERTQSWYNAALGHSNGSEQPTITFHPQQTQPGPTAKSSVASSTRNQHVNPDNEAPSCDVDTLTTALYSAEPVSDEDAAGKDATFYEQHANDSDGHSDASSDDGNTLRLLKRMSMMYPSTSGHRLDPPPLVPLGAKDSSREKRRHTTYCKLQPQSAPLSNQWLHTQHFPELPAYASASSNASGLHQSSPSTAGPYSPPQSALSLCQALPASTIAGHGESRTPRYRNSLMTPEYATAELTPPRRSSLRGRHFSVRHERSNTMPSCIVISEDPRSSVHSMDSMSAYSECDDGGLSVDKSFNSQFTVDGRVSTEESTRVAHVVRAERIYPVAIQNLTLTHHGATSVQSPVDDLPRQLESMHIAQDSDVATTDDGDDDDDDDDDDVELCQARLSRQQLRKQRASKRLTRTRQPDGSQDNECLQQEREMLKSVKASLQRERVQISFNLSRLQAEAALLLDPEYDQQQQHIEMMTRQLQVCDQLIDRIRTGRSLTHLTDAERSIIERLDVEDALALIRLQGLASPSSPSSPLHPAAPESPARHVKDCAQTTNAPEEPISHLLGRLAGIEAAQNSLDRPHSVAVASLFQSIATRRDMPRSRHSISQPSSPQPNRRDLPPRPPQSSAALKALHRSSVVTSDTVTTIVDGRPQAMAFSLDIPHGPRLSRHANSHNSRRPSCLSDDIIAIMARADARSSESTYAPSRSPMARPASALPSPQSSMSATSTSPSATDTAQGYRPFIHSTFSSMTNLGAKLLPSSPLARYAMSSTDDLSAAVSAPTASSTLSPAISSVANNAHVNLSRDVPYRPPSIMVNGRTRKLSIPRLDNIRAQRGHTRSASVGTPRPTLGSAFSCLSPDPISLIPVETDELQDSPVFASRLYKLGGNRHWQRREFRFDGSYLICLRPKRERVAPGSVRYLLPDNASDGFYNTKPPLPMIGHPLISTPDANHQWVRYYQAPKWVIPVTDIEDVTLLTHRGFIVRECFAVITSQRQYVLRGKDRRELACWLFLLKRMVNAHRRAEEVAAAAEQEAVRRLADLSSQTPPSSTHSLHSQDADTSGGTAGRPGLSALPLSSASGDVYVDGSSGALPSNVRSIPLMTPPSTSPQLPVKSADRPSAGKRVSAATGLGTRTPQAAAMAAASTAQQWRFSVGELMGIEPSSRRSIRTVRKREQA